LLFVDVGRRTPVSRTNLFPPKSLRRSASAEKTFAFLFILAPLSGRILAWRARYQGLTPAV
jgi:hypothetical protein